MGKSALRVNSEPILGHRLANTKLPESKMAMTEKKRQGGSRFNLMSRKDSGLNKQPSHPAKEKAAGENTSKNIFSMATRSFRRHSAPPVQPQNIDLEKEFSLTEFIDAGRINTTLMKSIRKKQVRETANSKITNFYNMLIIHALIQHLERNKSSITNNFQPIKL